MYLKYAHLQYILTRYELHFRMLPDKYYVDRINNYQNFKLLLFNGVLKKLHIGLDEIRKAFKQDKQLFSE